MTNEEQLAYHLQQAARELALALAAKTEVARAAHMRLLAEHSSAAQVLRAARIRGENISESR